MAVVLQECYNNSMTRTSGIYKLKIGNKFYIGGSTVLETRFTKHKSKLKTNTHSNFNMLDAYKECQDVEFEILELCTKEDVKIREQFYIDQFFGTDNCMNIDPLSTGSPKRPVGYKLSDAQKKNLSEKMKGNTNGRFGKGVKKTVSAEAKARQIAGTLKAHNKPVIIITEAGEKIMFESIKHAAEALAVPHKTMSNWTRGICKPSSHKGYIGWTFSHGDDFISL